MIVTYGSADHVGVTLSALAPQLLDGDEVVIVDNQPGDGSVEAARAAFPDVRVVSPGLNLGFAGGCNAGARAVSAPLVLFLNPDAVPAPGFLDSLRAPALERPDWGAWQALVLMGGGAEVNTRGGLTHFLGFGWAGGCGTPVGTVDAGDVGFASGAALCVRRSVWHEVGGFDDDYFMYGEDLDLSLRVWLAGYRVGIAPGAVVEHDYDFHKGGYKWYLLELNRWRTVIGDYPGALLLLLAPALLAFELALLPVAARGGWLREKLRAQAAVARGMPGLMRRRRRVQALRRVGAREFAERLTAELDSPYLALPPSLGVLVSLQATYWRLVLTLLR